MQRLEYFVHICDFWGVASDTETSRSCFLIDGRADFKAKHEYIIEM